MTSREILLWGATGLGMTLDQLLDIERAELRKILYAETNIELVRFLDGLCDIIPYK